MAAADRLGPEPGSGAALEEIQRDIERTREQAAETLRALAAKLDVKERAKRKITDSKKRMAQGSRDTKELAGELLSDKTVAAVAGIAALTALAGLLLWMRRH